MQLQQAPADNSIWRWAATSDGGTVEHHAIINLTGTSDSTRLAIAQRLVACYLLAKLPERSLYEACECLADLYRKEITPPAIVVSVPVTRKISRMNKTERPRVVYQD